jgi:hypothetical protein
MRALRLETIEPVADPDALRASEAEAALVAAREAGYEAGFVAGQAAATEVHLDDQAKLSAALVEAICDGQLTNEAARQAVLGPIGPLVAKLFRALAPGIAEAGLAEEIARRAEAAVRAVPAATPRIRCAPEVAPVVEALLGARGIPGSVEAAPELLPREAEVAWAQGFDRIDLDACIAEIDAAIGLHLLPGESDEERRYG